MPPITGAGAGTATSIPSFLLRKSVPRITQFPPFTSKPRARITPRGVLLAALVAGALFYQRGVEAPPQQHHAEIAATAEHQTPPSAQVAPERAENPAKPLQRPDAAIPQPPSPERPASWPSFIGNPELLVTTPPPEGPMPASAKDIQNLQNGLKAFGLMDEPTSGSFDAPTQAALRKLSILAGRNLPDAATAIAALKEAEARVAASFWALAGFPFGKTVPSWLLASLDTSDDDRIQRAFTSHQRAGNAFQVSLTARGLSMRGQVQPKVAWRPNGCSTFSAVFERPPFLHRVAGSACRDKADGRWRTE